MAKWKTYRNKNRTFKLNLPVVTKKYHAVYKKYRFQLVDEPQYRPSRRFVRNDLAEKLVKSLRTDKINAFRRSLVFNVVDTFNSKQQSITETIKGIFEGEDIQTEYKVPGLDHRIDIYFHKYQLAVEVDEYDHCDRDTESEEETERHLKGKFNCVFIRINPDESNFNINRGIKEIHRHNIKPVEKLTEELTEKETKKSVINYIKIGLIELSLEF